MGSARRAGKEQFKRKACFLCGAGEAATLTLQHDPNVGLRWHCHYIIPCAVRRLIGKVRSWF